MDCGGWEQQVPEAGLHVDKEEGITSYLKSRTGWFESGRPSESVTAFLDFSHQLYIMPLHLLSAAPKRRGISNLYAVFMQLIYSLRDNHAVPLCFQLTCTVFSADNPSNT
jgi:hypothetical protein